IYRAPCQCPRHRSSSSGGRYAWLPARDNRTRHSLATTTGARRTAWPVPRDDVFVYVSRVRLVRAGAGCRILPTGSWWEYFITLGLFLYERAFATSWAKLSETLSLFSTLE